MTDKQTYKTLCETEGTDVPLFLQYWWMEAVSQGKRWDVALARRDGQVVAALPYLHGTKLGLRYILPPQLTMWSGPWLRYPADKDAVRDLLRQVRALRPALHIQCYNADIADILVEAGYTVAQRRTYRFDRLEPLPQMMAAASPLRRRDHAKLAAQLTIAPITPERFADMHLDHWRRRGTRDLIPRSLIEGLCQAAVSRRQAILDAAYDADGHPQAAIFAPYDSQCGYLIMSAIADGAPRNAMSHLVWHTIDALRPLTRAFDFEGSSEPGVERYYRSFGPEKKTFLQAKKMNPIIKLILNP